MLSVKLINGYGISFVLSLIIPVDPTDTYFFPIFFPPPRPPNQPMVLDIFSRYQIAWQRLPTKKEPVSCLLPPG